MWRTIAKQWHFPEVFFEEDKKSPSFLSIYKSKNFLNSFFLERSKSHLDSAFFDLAFTGKPFIAHFT